MRLVYKFYIRHTEELDRLFRISNNLYNQALYLFRQQLDADGTWLWYNDMDKLMKKTLNLEGLCNYKLLKSQCSQQVLRVLDKNIKAYCKGVKDWKKHPEKSRLTVKVLRIGRNTPKNTRGCLRCPITGSVVACSTCIIPISRVVLRMEASGLLRICLSLSHNGRNMAEI